MRRIFTLSHPTRRYRSCSSFTMLQLAMEPTASDYQNKPCHTTPTAQNLAGLINCTYPSASSPSLVRNMLVKRKRKKEHISGEFWTSPERGALPVLVSYPRKERCLVSPTYRPADRPTQMRTATNEVRLKERVIILVEPIRVVNEKL